LKTLIFVGALILVLDIDQVLNNTPKHLRPLTVVVVQFLDTESHWTLITIDQVAQLCQFYDAGMALRKRFNAWASEGVIAAVERQDTVENIQ